MRLRNSKLRAVSFALPRRCAFSVAVTAIFMAMACLDIWPSPAIAQSPMPQPSFNCAKAATQIEHLICSDPELAQWDGRMGDAYKQTYVKRAGDNRRALIDDQRQWVALRNAQCNQPDLAGTKSCILELTKSRTSVLQQQVAQSVQLSPPSTESQWRPNMANASPAGVAPQSTMPESSVSEATSGTAFFVSKDGAAITNSHVVERCQQIRVGISGQQGSARVSGRDDKNDLALLATDLHPVQAANWRPSVQQGEDIVVYGFPLAGVLATGGNVATGNVTALAGLGDDSRFLQISAPVQPGNSGGPLLDRNGNVVGIVVAKLNALNIASATGDIPQNVNFAIKASVAGAFLDAQNVVHAEGGGTNALSTPAITERAKSFTAQVICVR
jgi:S1-C subfamily serine protease